MSLRYWIIAVAFGLVAASATGQDGGNQTDETQGTQTSSAQNEGETDPFSLPVQIIESKESAEARERREQISHSLQEDDLEAQRGMENATKSIDKATWWMLLVAAVNAGLVAVGTGLLIWTLCLMRKANQVAVGMAAEGRKAAVGAIDAVAEAKKANEQNRLFGELQTRAYLVVENPRLKYSEYGARVELDIRNVGNSPAYHVTAVFIAQSKTVTSDGDDIDWTTPEPSKREMVRLIGAGVTTPCAFGILDKEIRSTFREMDPGKLIKQVDLIVEYQTVFDRERFTTDTEIAVTLLNAPDVKRSLISEQKPPGNARFELDTIDILPGGWVKAYQSKE